MARSIKRLKRQAERIINDEDEIFVRVITQITGRHHLSLYCDGTYVVEEKINKLAQLLCDPKNPEYRLGVYYKTQVHEYQMCFASFVHDDLSRETTAKIIIDSLRLIPKLGFTVTWNSQSYILWNFMLMVERNSNFPWHQINRISHTDEKLYISLRDFMASEHVSVLIIAHNILDIKEPIVLESRAALVKCMITDMHNMDDQCHEFFSKIDPNYKKEEH